MKARIFLPFLLCILTANSFGQDLWQLSTDPDRSDKDRQIVPAEYKTFEVDLMQLENLLSQAPLEKDLRAKNSNYFISLPLPDGSIEEFRFVEAPVMADELTEKYPQIRSYLGISTQNPATSVRFSISHKGFNGMILTPDKTAYIDPYSKQDDEYYICYWKSAFYATTEKVFDELPPVSNDMKLDIEKYDKAVETKYQDTEHSRKVLAFGQRTSSGTELRTYRLALASTGEYTAFHGGTVADGLAAMNVSMTRVNGVYERDVSIRMVLVPNNDLLVYTNGGTDPYTNNNGGAMLGENISTCNSVIGSANYDIGHVFSTGGGGVAYLGVPCTANKAGGVTGGAAPVGDPFDIDYVCHEMGHQFGANHTQNNPCNRVASAAFEPGSASTIMGYAGICAPNLQSNSDDHFHNHSYNEIINYSVSGNGNNCPVITVTGNTPPDVELGLGGFFIPIETPFELTPETYGDSDGDALTFNWEEYDLGPQTAGGDPDLSNPSGNAPVFRSWPSSTDPTRVFPRIQDLVNNTTVVGEHLADYSRDLTFKCTVRDNSPGGGGVRDDLLAFEMTNLAGPFLVTAPNTGVTYPGNTVQTVTWDVANTDAAPVNCANVDIFLSVDGGFTYPTLLVSGVPNDGSQDVLIPAGETITARIKVKAAGNVFFDISNQNFTIGPAAGTNDVDAGLTSIVSPQGDYCAGTVTPEISVTNFGALDLTSFDVEYDVDGGTTQVYNWSGTLTTGQTANITLANQTPGTGPHTFNVNITNPNGTTDDNPTNNSGSSSFSTVAGGTSVTLTILTDCWGEEVSWDLQDSGGNIIDNVGTNTLADQTTYTWNYCLAAGCYDFNIFDSFGDGLDGTASGCAIDGDYDITDSFGNVLVQMGAPNYGAGTSHNFCVPVGTPGCTDNSACNFDPAATVDDGSCVYPGCTTPSACNYDPAAGCDDGSCQASGCDDPTACNYDPSAGCNDGSCLYPGCNTVGACNWSPLAGCDDGSCTFPGCQDPAACNYDATAGCNDGSCVFPGCTDPAACNYDATAGCDDGSCTIPGCTDNTACNYDAAAGCDDGSCEFLSCNCQGDFNGDNTVNVQDLLILLADWDCSGVCIADINNDGVTNTSDMLIFLSVFGNNCN